MKKYNIYIYGHKENGPKGKRNDVERERECVCGSFPDITKQAQDPKNSFLLLCRLCWQFGQIVA